MTNKIENKKLIAVIGLGYVGLPLAIEFGKKRKVVGYDIDNRRIAELNTNFDKTLEVDECDFHLSKEVRFTNDVEHIKPAQIYLVTVPTPIDINNEPNLEPLSSACKMIGSILSENDIVIFESTVYPGVTEEVCVPILEQYSGMKYGTQFFCGYSPERINPGDKEHRLCNIIKIVSGTNPDVTSEINTLYCEIVEAGTFVAENIKTAEAAKVIENTQRDLNIALMNELSFIFNKLDIDTRQVIDAASTKWNFLNFEPGLVGGHCIGVDPYYLTYKAKQIGYDPEVILAGRRVNNDVPKYIVGKLIKTLLKNRVDIVSCKILILGITFKENCPDLRNSKVIDLIESLDEYSFNYEIHDPYADYNELPISMKSKTIIQIPDQSYDAVIVSVAHSKYVALGIDKIRKFLKNDAGIIFDLKGIYKKNESDFRL